MNRDEPGGDQIDQVMKQIGVSDAIDCGIGGKKEEGDVGDIADAAKQSMRLVSPLALIPLKKMQTYLEVTRGIIFPQVMVSTSRRKGIMDKTL